MTHVESLDGIAQSGEGVGIGEKKKRRGLQGRQRNGVMCYLEEEVIMALGKNLKFIRSCVPS